MPCLGLDPLNPRAGLTLVIALITLNRLHLTGSPYRIIVVDKFGHNQHACIVETRSQHSATLGDSRLLRY